MTRLQSLSAFCQREARAFLTVHASDRPWTYPLAAAAASGVPLLLGAWIGGIGHASLASLGAMTILYVPRTTLDRRMVAIMVAAFAMIACHALGLAGHLAPVARIPIIAVVAAFVSMGCRYFGFGPPGASFFVLAAAIGAYSPGTAADAPLKLGYFTLGAIGAVIIAFIYNMHILRFRKPLPPALRPADMIEVGIKSVVIGLFVGLSLVVAELVGLGKPYWVAISCLAIIQISSLRASWDRQMHRIIGTIIGLVVTWALWRYAANPLYIALVVTVLTFLVEAAIVRHYAFAAIFITPLSIFLAETSTLITTDGSMLIIARFADTVLGGLIGLVGAICLHSQTVHRWGSRRQVGTTSRNPD